MPDQVGAAANLQNAASSSYSYNIAAPDTFDFNSPADWPKWKKRFERFRLASKLNTQTEEEQVNTFIYLMGEKADDIMVTFGLTNVEEKVYETVMNKFVNYFAPKSNVIYERARFHTRVQNPGESANDFITALHNLAKNCNYGELREEFIRDRIVVGIADKKISERMQLDETLTLDKAVKMITQSEEVRKQVENLQQSSINQVSAHKGNRPSTRNSGPARRSHDKPSKKPEAKNQKFNQAGPCKWCGGEKHERKSCPAKNSTCYTCNNKGHYSKVCKKKEVCVVNEEDLEVDSLHIDSIDAKRAEGNASDNVDWTALIQVNGKNIRFKIDTGSDVSALPSQYANRRGLAAAQKSLTGPDATSLKVFGVDQATLSYKDKTIRQTIYYIHNLSQPILGKVDAVKLGLVQRINAISSGAALSLKDIQDQFPQLFKGIGKIPGKCKLTIKPDVKPVAISSPRRIAIPLIDKVKNALDKMVLEGVISPVDGPTEWCSPMVVTFKKDSSPRICVDLRELNRGVQREYHPIPEVHYTLNRIQDAKYFSKLDAASGFYQIVLDEDSRLYTTFITPFGRFCFNRLPFGITCAPELFQKKMQDILKDCDGIVCLMDDILVYSNTQAEHDTRLRKVLTKLSEAGVTLNLKKVQINVRSIEFLGHLIEEEGIRIHPDKIKAIKDMEPPTDKKGVKRIFGMINFLAKAIPNKAPILEPLQALLKNEAAFIWGPDQERAFSKFKEILTSAPTLARYDPSRKTIVTADASSYGIGGALLQVQRDGNLKPIAYTSRLLTETERRYAQIEKEALAITYTCEKFSDYITSIEVTLETDHKPLIPILTSKALSDLSPRLQRYRIRLMRFDYTIVHVPGRDLVTADALSRQPLSQPVSTDFEEEVETHVIGTIAQLPVTRDKLSEIIANQKEDPELAAVRIYIRNGWPDRGNLPDNLRTYWEKKWDITCQNDLLLYESKILIPQNMRREMLQKVHEGHLGITKCRARANQSMWWPGMSTQIAETVDRCEVCAQYRTNRHEPLIQIYPASRPWQKVGMDLFEVKDDWYLIIIDRYSRYPDVEKIPNMRMDTVIGKMAGIFARQGVPEEVFTDNGTQFHPFQESKVFENF